MIAGQGTIGLELDGQVDGPMTVVCGVGKVAVTGHAVAVVTGRNIALLIPLRGRDARPLNGNALRTAGSTS